MTTIHYGDDRGQDTCLPPSEFVRLRYFYGQRLGVVDFADEQAFHAGKHRFANLLLHGSGVLCGLTAERHGASGAGASQATTLLRVRRGAALDGFGRDIVVGFDQCIDVAAWLRQHPLALPPIASPGATPPTSLSLWVAVRYRECPSDPAPAPRDPCGCDAGGCEFARLREGFDLRLLTEAEARLIAAEPALTPHPVARDEGLVALVAPRTPMPCPSPPTDPSLLLARVEVALRTEAAGLAVEDIAVIDNAIPERQMLVSTATLQRSLVELLAHLEGAGVLGQGPRWGALAFRDGGSSGQELSLEILSDGTPLSRNPLAQPARLKVQLLKFVNNDWDVVKPDAIAYRKEPSATIALSWKASQLEKGHYRLVIQNNALQPAVDEQLRPLTPSVWARHFRLVDDAAGTLSLADQLLA
ncbi:MAG: hypothetical protein VKP63_09965 [Cyanobacteriota bacterium]|jgi:hypothetical protein|nr:hypothetical protein [Cyanobacteriota bacterium]